MNTNLKLLTFAMLGSVSAMATLARADEHFDIAPYLVNGQLLTGGLDHAGNSEPPSISVYGFEFGEDLADPFNPSDPGINQAAGVGNLPAGASLRYDILSSLLYWDGTGSEVNWTTPTGDTLIQLYMGTSIRTLDGDSGEQVGALIQSVVSDGSLHKHFTTSLYEAPGTSNVPGDASFVAPADGIYAFSIDLTLTSGSNSYTTDPIWLVFNNGVSEDAHGLAIASLVPEPGSMGLLGLAGLGLMHRRRRSARAAASLTPRLL